MGVMSLPNQFLNAFQVIDVLSKMAGLWINTDKKILYSQQTHITFICPMRKLQQYRAKTLKLVCIRVSVLCWCTSAICQYSVTWPVNETLIVAPTTVKELSLSLHSQSICFPLLTILRSMVMAADQQIESNFILKLIKE